MTDQTSPTILSRFQRFGPVADLHDLNEDIRILWQLPLRYLQGAVAPARVSPQEIETPLDSTFAYISNGEFNAGIRHEDRAVAACVFVGVPIVAFRACRHLASRIDIRTGLPICDDQQRLVIFSQPLPLEHDWHILKENISQQAMEDFSFFEETAPDVNMELATFLFDIAMRYVAMHEAMHFVLGHARYCQVNLCLDSFTDASEERQALDPVVSQTLEFIADRHTIAGIMADLRMGRLYHDWCTNIPAEITVERDVWQRRLVISAITLVSKLWKGHSSQRFADFSLSYPHPYERIVWMISGLNEMLGGSAQQDNVLTFALNVATLERNFTSTTSYSELIEHDLTMLRAGVTSQLDRSYAVVRAKATELQKKLYQTYGAFYPEVQTN